MKRPLAFYAAFFFAALTRRMLSYLMIVYGFQSLGGGAWSGVLYFCVFAPYLVFGLSAGVLVDRTSKRKGLGATLGGTALLFAVLTIASAEGWFGFAEERGWILAGGTFLYGLAYAIIYPCFLAAVPQFTDREAIGRATITVNVLSTVALAYAPLLVGFLRQWLNWTALLGTLAVGSGLALGLARWSRVADGETVGTRMSDWESLKQLFAFSRRNRSLAHIFVFAALFCLLMVGPLEVLLPNLLERGFGMSALPAGLYIAVGGTGLVTGSMLALAIIGRGRTTVWLAGAAIAASAMMVGSIHAPRGILGVLLFSSGLLGGVFSSLIIANAQGGAPDWLRGRVMGLFALIMGGVPSLGGLGAGLLAGRYGVPVAIEVAFGGAMGMFLIAGLVLREEELSEPT